ncbi:hypothetical protein U9M48_000958 [Paspalum notatum var. saurae]|uniref:R13L1/DRL21-like LRR repeat region domain-containing protein n=1 Tax=Paspalum notatum var. saurae TaxID=547442 RepID=A0AAQ3PFR2_PASNO
MKHLRYFSFCYPHAGGSVTNLILPSTFSKLYQMQTISLCTGVYVFYSDGIANLIRWRHINTWSYWPPVGRMKSLQTMHHFHGYMALRVLEAKREAHLAMKKRVTELKLTFHSTTDPELEAEVLEGLCPPKDLQELTIDGYNGTSYPRWMVTNQHPDAPEQLQNLVFLYCGLQLTDVLKDSKFFTHLLNLTIKCCKWDRLPENMERLVSLQSLNIFSGVNNYGANKMGLLPALPQSLRELRISSWNCVLQNIEQLVCLQSLEIQGCDEIEHLPKLPLSLKEICIIDCDVLCRTCQDEEHQNWRKIQHIPGKMIMSGCGT